MSFFVVTNAAYGGKYCEDGTFDDGMGNVKPKYRKAGTSLYMYYVETNWRINDIGNLGDSGSNVYAFASGGNTPPTGMNWTDNNTGNDLIVANDFYSTSTTPTLNNTYIHFGSSHNGRPVYGLSGRELKYSTSAGMWIIEDLDLDPDNPIILYQSDSSASTPPLTGWFIVNGSSPPPTLIGPSCGETATTTTTTTTTTSAPGGSTTTTTTTTAAPTTKSIQITSTNYNGQTAQVTFYSVAAPNTPVNLGPQTLPYSRSGDDVYGSYELNFTAYNKVCVVTLNGTTTTTTTTTAAPTTSTTTAAPTTTTTTTTAAPGGVVGFIASGDEWTSANGTFCPAGTYDGVAYYTGGAGYYMWRQGSNWFIHQTDAPGNFYYSPWYVETESILSMPPLTGWINGGTLTQTTCGEATTTDTFWADVKLLLPLDSGFTDLSTTNTTFTSLGGVSIDTSTKQFGTGSLPVGGFPAGYGISTTSAPTIGSGDFTIEWWQNFADVGTSNLQTIMSWNAENFNTAYMKVRRGNSTQWVFEAIRYDNIDEIYRSTQLFFNNPSGWAHIAIVRQSGTWRIYVNGTQAGSAAENSVGSSGSGVSGPLSFPGGNVAFGRAYGGGGGSYAPPGYIDDIRLTLVARYPNGTTFNIPTSANPQG